MPNSPTQPLTPTTTAQQDLTFLGQRKINLIWEYSQAAIALIVVVCNMVAALFYVFHQQDLNVPPVLSSSLFLVIGFYFGRTNHSQIGGVGEKPNQEYKGR